MAADGRLPEKMDKTTTAVTQGLSVQACPAAEAPPRCTSRDWCFWITIIGSFFFFSGIFFYIIHKDDKQPRYFVAIDAVAGLDPATDLGHRPTLDPVFNLTLRVASLSHRKGAGACVYPGMYVEVSYRGIPLAASATATEQLCAGPMNATEQRVVARGAGVVVPGSALDSLAADMRGGVQVFEVSLRGWGGVVLPCWARRVGDAGALRRECALRWYSR